MTLASTAPPSPRTSPQAEALRVVAHAHRAAVVHRVEALHALRAALLRIWPAAVSAWPNSVGDCAAPRRAPSSTPPHLSRRTSAASREPSDAADRCGQEAHGSGGDRAPERDLRPPGDAPRPS
ncbi:hypothetical protein [Streptomyces murinus]|uniref:hypothetical protein n=1 Tax=Streptomyces murinus TaxID=33900 RepID=UPI003D67A308